MRGHKRTDFSYLIGTKSHLLTVVDIFVPKSGRTKLICSCECGKTTKLFPYQIITGDIKSCGCLRHDKAYNATHQLSHTKLYGVWETMRLRCYSPKNNKYYLYGARGITICDEWRNDFMAFREWACANGYGEGLSLDRIDNNKGYSPDNCRWTNRKTQQRNRRVNVMITYNGETHCLVEWCEILNLPKRLIQARIRERHWSPEKAFTTPVHHRR